MNTLDETAAVHAPLGHVVQGGEWSQRNAQLLERPSSPTPWLQNVVVPRVDRYAIVVEPGLLNAWGRHLQFVAPQAERIWVISDSTVWSLHGEALMRAACGAKVLGVHLLEPGEPSKSVSAWQSVLEWLSAQRAQRRDVLLAFGGSVVSDLVGFVAATYMRGVPYLNVPTTLLAQVDGAMGGKVAVNTAEAKNLVGAFHQPTAVLTDPSLTTSLVRAERANGLAEALKTGALDSREAFEFVAKRVGDCLDGNVDALVAVVRLCSSLKMHLLDPDPYEVDLRRVLNFGHTLAHPIETCLQYRGIRHGEAVAIGMAAAFRLSHGRGLIEAEVVEEFISVLERAELPTCIADEQARRVLQHLELVAAVRGGCLREVLPLMLGRVAIVDDVGKGEFLAALVGDSSLGIRRTA